MTSPRPEYPRPQFERNEWLNLNGTWHFAYDDANAGVKERWFDKPAFDQKITVPFAFQSALSGIHDIDFHDVVWYARDFTLPAQWANKRVLLHFGAVDYRAWVWVNGVFATYHEGGHTPFHTEISAVLRQGENRITVRVEDPSADREQPRGKQYWERESQSIFYTRTTGIWQTVWLEPVADVYLASLKITPDVDAGQARVECQLDGASRENISLTAEAAFDGASVALETAAGDDLSMTLNLGDAPRLWSPESPALYDLVIRVRRGDTIIDQVKSYFGMRKIGVENGVFTLNNQPYYMRLVLDQGYHPQGLLTFPDDATIRADVEMTKTMGFNGARKHQKIEDPRYLYWADHLGLLVWGEMANAYAYSEKAVRRITAEWQEAVERDYNHPCIVAWVPINESWGIPAPHTDKRQVDHLLALYYHIRSLDPTRPVISNDGWEHARSDLLTIHDYEGSGDVLRHRYGDLDSILAARPANRDLYVDGFQYAGEPIIVSEFGGIAYKRSAQEGWGYTAAADDDEFIRRYRDVIAALLACPLVQGFCYTQLTDVEQEINGLLTYDRQPKVDLAIIHAITTGQDE